MQMFRDLAIALSLANLCFFRAWGELLEPYNYYFMKTPPFINFAAIILNVLLLAAVFWIGLNFARRSDRWYAMGIARWAFLVVLIVPLNGIRQVLPPVANLIAIVGKNGFIILSFVLIMLGMLFLLRWHRQVIRVISILILVLFPFFLMTFSQAVYSLAKYDATIVDEPLASPPIQEKKSTPRVLWLLFDGMDQRVTFFERPPTVKLPEIDLLRRNALYATNAYPPTNATLLSLPSLITGRRIDEALPNSLREMMITFRGARKAVGWSTQSNVFSKALAAGFNTAVVGWYHPYCRVIGISLTTCSWEEVFGSTAGSHKTSVFETMIYQIYNLWPWRARQHHIESYLRVLQDAKKAVVDSSLGLILAHFPVPHKPYIYDRMKGDFTLLNYSATGYLDNLVLADLTLGELRSVMEAAHTWENTNILVTSDHWWLYSSLLDGRVDQRVPFILKLAGQKEGVVYEPAFNTILTHNLFLALLRGEVGGPKSVMAWLDQHRSKVESSEYSSNHEKSR